MREKFRRPRPGWPIGDRRNAGTTEVTMPPLSRPARSRQHRSAGNAPFGEHFQGFRAERESDFD
jgi:hypothetical protein